MEPIDLFHIGPQKCGTTWIFRCLAEHPEVMCPPRDKTHYFDMHYWRGRDWLSGHYTTDLDGRKRLDPTPSYIRSLKAPRRIFTENSEAKIAACIRHPVDRAISHYWHEKKKRRFNFAMQEVFENYDLFQNWVEPGFYADHLRRYLEFFRREQLLVQLHDDMEADPKEFFRELCDFYGISNSVTPSLLLQRVNVARPRAGPLRTTRAYLGKMGRIARRHIGGTWQSGAVSRPRAQSGQTEPRVNVAVGQPVWVLEELMALYLPEIEALEEMLDVDLRHWKTLEGIV